MPIKGSLLGKGSEGGCYERGRKGHDKVKKLKIIQKGTAEATCKNLDMRVSIFLCLILLSPTDGSPTRG